MLSSQMLVVQVNIRGKAVRLEILPLRACVALDILIVKKVHFP